MVLIEMIIEITIDFQYNSVIVSFAHLADNWDYSWSDFITHGFFLIGLSRFLYFNAGTLKSLKRANWTKEFLNVVLKVSFSYRTTADMVLDAWDHTDQ